jgi:RNA polymerase sigma-70 factor, ECF subfamily
VRCNVSAGALSLSRIVPTPPPPTAAELKLMRLVERVQQDDLSAFEELYRLTRDDVARTLFHLVGRRSDLEDLLQETYLKLLKAVPRYKGQSRFRTFLYGVCANVALMHLRWWRRRREDVTDEPPDGPAPGIDPETAAQAMEASKLVQRALSCLSAKKRVVFVYHELCDMGPDEIAEATDTPYNTVRSRLHHARMEFTEAMRALTGTEAAS